ncbi:formate dehydrogenase accessory sulfurtransferase FdhD [Rhodoligotrophos defluvii]|uniref:formate dehydrogenase accessory sulfurtransferase FdhD n=1 Tax=Rhodoligotrophos defluvii TaxID=2561934 RepID=UPI0010C9F7F1|nr:formate dehydrogenase accessory sulfurtransferase FdhD [Rhodoligotrophos defluvii]
MSGAPARALDKADEASSVTVHAVACGPHGTQAISWALAEEVPVALMYNSEPHAVMMASPADLKDFAIGFSLSEGIVQVYADISQVLVMPVEGGFACDVAVEEAALAAARKPKRAMEGRSGCGICGVAEIGQAVRRQRKVAPLTLDPQAVGQGFAELSRHQPMNRVNHSVHAAAWCSLGGKVRLAREDVGRHNALDKLLGALVAQGSDLSDGFVVMSSRCSFELVQKAATLGVRGLATISAPTALALALAREAGLALAAKAGERVVLFPNS